MKRLEWEKKQGKIIVAVDGDGKESVNLSIVDLDNDCAIVNLNRKQVHELVEALITELSDQDKE